MDNSVDEFEKKGAVQDVKLKFRQFTNGLYNKISNIVMDNVPPGYDLDTKETPTIEDLKRFGNRYPLSALLPWESYDADHHLYFNKDTVGFCLIGSPAADMTMEGIKGLNAIMSEEHRPDTVMQLQQFSIADVEGNLSQWQEAKFRSGDSDRDDIFKLLSDNRLKHFSKAKWQSMFEDEPFLVRDNFVVISYFISNEFEDCSEEDVKFLERTREAQISTLQSSGISCVSLRPSLLINIVGSVLNPQMGPRSNKTYDPINPICNQITDSDMRLLLGAGSSTIEKGGEKFTVIPFHVEQFPEHWTGMGNGEFIGSFTNKVQRLPFHYTMSLNILFPDSVSQKSRAKAKSTRAIQMSETPMAKYNRTFEERRRDWEFVQLRLAKGDKIVKASLQINIFVKQGSEQYAIEKLRSVFGNKAFILTRSHFIPYHSLMAGLPGGLGVETRKALVRARYFQDILTWNCANVAPILGEYKGDSDPIMMFLGRRGQIIRFSPFSNEKGNFNISCCAKSGGGKSFYTQEWVMSILGFGGRAYIIDSGGSYENLCELLNGVYIDVAKGRLCFNPFTNCSESDREYFIKDQMPMLKQIIGAMCSPDTKPTTEELAVIEDAIFYAWDKKKNKATITTVREGLDEIFHNDEMRKEVAGSLSMRIKPYTKDGSYARYFEGENNVDLSNAFCVLELDSLNPTPDLMAVILFIVMMNITNEMYLTGDKSIPKLAIIDEAWKLLGKGSAGGFIEEGYRVARKHGGSFMTITQSPSDYYKSPVAQAAYEQSDFNVYMELKTTTIDRAVRENIIEEEMASVLKTLRIENDKYSEIAINTPGGFFVGRFVVDPISANVYGTKAKDLQFIKERRGRGANIVDSIYALVDHKKEVARQKKEKEMAL